MLMYLNCEVSTEVDEIDFDYLSGFEFILGGYGYLRCNNGLHRKEYLHKIIAKRIGLDISKITDHKDTNIYNNKRYNLREATKIHLIIN